MRPRAQPGPRLGLRRRRRRLDPAAPAPARSTVAAALAGVEQSAAIGQPPIRGGGAGGAGRHDVAWFAQCSLPLRRDQPARQCRDRALSCAAGNRADPARSPSCDVVGTRVRRLPEPVAPAWRKHDRRPGESPRQTGRAGATGGGCSQTIRHRLQTAGSAGGGSAETSGYGIIERQGDTPARARHGRGRCGDRLARCWCAAVPAEPMVFQAMPEHDRGLVHINSGYMHSLPFLHLARV